MTECEASTVTSEHKIENDLLHREIQSLRRLVDQKSELYDESLKIMEKMRIQHDEMIKAQLDRIRSLEIEISNNEKFEDEAAAEIDRLQNLCESLQNRKTADIVCLDNPRLLEDVDSAIQLVIEQQQHQLQMEPTDRCQSLASMLSHAFDELDAIEALMTSAEQTAVSICALPRQSCTMAAKPASNARVVDEDASGCLHGSPGPAWKCGDEGARGGRTPLQPFGGENNARWGRGERRGEWMSAWVSRRKRQRETRVKET
jgi:hypothetical protein